MMMKEKESEKSGEKQSMHGNDWDSRPEWVARCLRKPPESYPKIMKFSKELLDGNDDVCLSERERTSLVWVNRVLCDSRSFKACLSSNTTI